MNPKKHLGQNFLTNDYFAELMCDAARVSRADTVLEIGPGTGVLTRVLLSRAKKVIAIEKDESLITLLKEKFAQEIKNGKLILTPGDILTTPSTLWPTPYKLVANIPYYITGEIIRHFLERKQQPLSITLMLQREVAERIVARDKKESILSLSVKAYGEPSIIAVVKAEYFYPKPKVDSAILTIDSISKKFFSKLPEKKFFALLKTGFSHKRKMLFGNLATVFPKGKLQTAFSALAIDPKIRAEDLSLKDWHSLATQVHVKASP